MPASFSNNGSSLSLAFTGMAQNKIDTKLIGSALITLFAYSAIIRRDCEDTWLVSVSDVCQIHHLAEKTHGLVIQNIIHTILKPPRCHV